MATDDGKSSQQDDSQTSDAPFIPRPVPIFSGIVLITREPRIIDAWIWLNKAKTEAWADIRTADWRAARWLLLPCWQAALLVAMLAVCWAPAAVGQFESSACRPDGSFSVWGTEYNHWTINGFFQITIGMGTLTFTQAKVIDIAWDILVGRVGQAALAVISWKAFSTYLRSSMIARPINYQTFWTIFMKDEPSVWDIVRITRDSRRRNGLHSRLAVVFVISSMVFVLAFPTLASAMSGYTSKVGAFVKDKDENFIQFSQFRLLAYVIHDGWRIGLSGDCPVNYTETYGDPVIDRGAYWGAGSDCEDRYGSNEDIELCYLQGNVSDYVSKYGFLGLFDDKTTWMNKTLPKPSLNISGYYLEQQSLYPPNGLAGYNWTNPELGYQPYSNGSSAAFTVSNTTYLLDDVISNGDCQPLGTYVWGFSFLQVFIVLILLQVWTLGLFLLYFKSNLLLKHNKITVPTKFKAAVELVDAMNEDFASIGVKISCLTNRQLNSHISKGLEGGRVELDSGLSTIKYNMLAGLKDWMKREKWWLCMLAILLVVDLSAWIPGLGSFYWIVVCWTLGIINSMAVGTTQKSRIFLSICGVGIGIVIGLCLLAYY